MFPHGVRPYETDPVLLRDGLGPATSAGNRLAGHFGGAVVAEIGLLRSPTSVGVIQPHDRTPALGDFARALVAHEDRLSCHVSLLCLRSTGSEA